MNKMINKLIDIAVITILIVEMICSAIFAIVLTVTAPQLAEAAGTMISLIVPVLAGNIIVPLLLDDYKDNCKSSEDK